MDIAIERPKDDQADPRDPLPSVIAHLVAAREVARFQPRDPADRLIGLIGPALEEAYRQIGLRGV